MVNAIWSAYGILANGQRTTLGGFGPTTTLAQGREVMKNLRANLPDATSYGFSVQFTFKDGSSKTSDLDEEKGTVFFSKIEKEVHADKVYIERERLRSEILAHGKALREHIGTIVEEPWKS